MGCVSTFPPREPVNSAGSGIQLICRTWTKTYNNLYDFNTDMENVKTKQINFDRPTRFFKKNGSYYHVGIDDQSELNKLISKIPQPDLVFDFVKKNPQSSEQGGYNLIETGTVPSNQIWFVVRSLPSNKYCLKEGDVFRLGKIKMRVKEILIEPHKQKDKQQEIIFNQKMYDNLTKTILGDTIRKTQVSEQKQCRVCLEEGEFNLPLISPCNCSGSTKYIHLKCIQLWQTKSLNAKVKDNVTVINWKSLSCQLCGSSIPFKIYLDGKKQFTVNIPHPPRPYIILNPIVKSKQNQPSKTYYLVSFAKKKELTIGRRNNMDIALGQDGSVSRLHSTITYLPTQGKNGRFLLQDKESRYGTMVLMRKPVELRSILNGLTLQIGGDIIQINLGKDGKQMMDCPQDLLNKSMDSEQELIDFASEQETKKEISLDL